MKQIYFILTLLSLICPVIFAQQDAPISDSKNAQTVSAFLAAAEKTGLNPILIPARDFPAEGTGFYRHKGWLAINPEKQKTATTQTEFQFINGTYDLIFVAVGEYDGESEYKLAINDKEAMYFKAPLSNYSYEEGVNYSFLIDNIYLKSGDQLKVTATVGSNDCVEFSRARWAGIILVKAGKGKQLLKKLQDKGTVETLKKLK